MKFSVTDELLQGGRDVVERKETQKWKRRENKRRHRWRRGRIERQDGNVREEDMSGRRLKEME